MQNLGRGMRLSECIRACEETWLQDYESEALRGSVEAQVIYSQLIMHGSGGQPANIPLALEHLKAASRHSAEAALRLGKMYLKGSKVEADLDEAYFYLRLTTLFRCKCGKFKEEYHEGKVSHVHPCYPTEALKVMNSRVWDPDAEQQFRDRYHLWKTKRRS